jgi:ABC-type dipeptide/oligopeptide/nickel transport system permease component
MLVFLLRRLLLLPVVLLVITLLIVGLMQLLSPEERAEAFASNSGELGSLERIVEENGLDQSFLVQYWNWLREALRGNLGFSKVSGQPVLDTMLERFPATLELALFALVPVIGLGIYLGTLAALHKGRWLDQTLRFLAITGYNLPAFMVAFYLMAVFYGGLQILPGVGNISNSNSLLLLTGDIKRVTGLLTVDTLLSGRLDVFWDVLRHLVLPVTTLVIVSSALIVQTMRASMLETLSSDFVRTAKAKGLPNTSVYLKHARRPALLSVITLGGFILSGLLTGSVLTETIFAYPGIGRWGAEAASTLDYAGILGFALFVAAFVVVANLVADVLYALVDPRVRFE